jgi:cyclic nucleotide gated channel
MYILIIILCILTMIHVKFHTIWYNAVKYLQIMILFFLPKHSGNSGANHAKNLLRGAVLAQYIPRLCRFLPMLISPTGFIFESAWASFFINLFTFMLSGHVVGSWWYLFGLQVGQAFHLSICHFFFRDHHLSLTASHDSVKKF